MFIVIEGLDGAGGETQAKRLEGFLSDKGKDVVMLSYPNPDSPIGKVIYEYLNKSIELSPEVQMALYVADFALDKEKIEDAKSSGKIVVSNRYFFSTLAYQCGAKGVDTDEAIDFANTMGIPEPDLVIYLDITPVTSKKRKIGENNNLDRHEEDDDLLAKVREAYIKLAKEDTFAKKSVMINGEKGVNEVTAEIQYEVSKLL